MRHDVYVNETYMANQYLWLDQQLAIQLEHASLQSVLQWEQASLWRDQKNTYREFLLISTISTSNEGVVIGSEIVKVAADMVNR